MVIALGVDLIEVERIKRAIERWGDRFLQRIFTPREIEYCSRQRLPHVSYAGRYAAKEAILKVLGVGWRDGISWRDIEVLTDKQGRPYVSLDGRAEVYCRQRNIKDILLSISHTDSYALCQSLALGPD